MHRKSFFETKIDWVIDVSYELYNDFGKKTYCLFLNVRPYPDYPNLLKSH